MTATAIGYIRVSTTGQVDDGVSLDAQRDRLAAWCLANGHELAEVHVDAGISGKRSDNRPALQLALDDVCRRRGVLVVYSLSRLARSTKDTLSISDRLEKSGADLVSLSEKIDTTSAAGKMVFRMLAVLAEFERDLVAERTTCAMQHKRHRRELVGNVPVGFNLADDGIHLVENQDEQRILKLVAELRADGFTLRQIADELTSQGFKTKGGRPWSFSTVQRIVNRRAA